MATTTDLERSARRAPLIFIGFFAALASGILTLLTVGVEIVSLMVLTLVAGTAIAVAAWGSGRAGKATLVALTVVLIGSIAMIGVFTAQIAAALLANHTGPADPADPNHLAAARERIDDSATTPAFRLELSEEELNAVLQDALQTADTPFRSITIAITNQVGDPGRIAFTGRLKNNGPEVDGVLSAKVVGTAIDLDIVDIDVGIFTVPELGRDALEDLIIQVADLQEALAHEGAEIQEITIGGRKIVITGINRGAGPIDPGPVIDTFFTFGDPEDVDPDVTTSTVAPTDTVPPEDIGPEEPPPSVITPRFEVGRVNAMEAPGEPVYLALGDSLAANVGVDEANLGYVSRFHTQLEHADATTYGLVNLSVSGETSGSLLSGGQLDAAEAVGDGRDVAYVTINIGANDLLGHLTSPVCMENFATAGCQDRLGVALVAYERNLTEVFDRLEEAFPDATVVVLTNYNPFAFGYGEEVSFEVATNATVVELNQLASAAALGHGFLVADGYTPLYGNVTQTTHIGDPVPDIHPTALGYDLLTGALVDALFGPDE